MLLKGDEFYIRKHPLATLGDLGNGHWFAVPSQYGGIKSALHIGIFLLTVDDNGKTIAVYNLDPRKKPSSAHDVVPGPRRILSKTLLGASPPIECMTGDGPITFIASVSGERALFRGFIDERDPYVLKAQRIETEAALFGSEVTACAGGGYFALNDGRIIKVAIERVGGLYGKDIARVRASISLNGKNGPLKFTSMALGELGWGITRGLYAVANDENIYRFSPDLAPDGKIEVVK